MKTVKTDIKIKRVLFRDEKVFFSLEDDGEIGARVKWFPKLKEATKEELQDFPLSTQGYVEMLTFNLDQKPQSV